VRVRGDDVVMTYGPIELTPVCEQCKGIVDARKP
jgi:hypothetical protein